MYIAKYMLYSINFILHAHNLDNFIYVNFLLRLTWNKNVKFVENNKTNSKHSQTVVFCYIFKIRLNKLKLTFFKALK